jgi:hypothetical protein
MNNRNLLVQYESICVEVLARTYNFAHERELRQLKRLLTCLIFDQALLYSSVSDTPAHQSVYITGYYFYEPEINLPSTIIANMILKKHLHQGYYMMHHVSHFMFLANLNMFSHTATSLL